MTEMLYDIHSLVITGGLLVAMSASLEAGYRLGRRRRAADDVSPKDHIGTIQGAILGILALLLGFTFSLSLQRFDSRSEAVVDEANAIGTAWLRASLLPSPLREDANRLFTEYIDLRIRAGQLALVKQSERRALLDAAGRSQAALWDLARRAVASAEPQARAPALFVEAVNDMIDSFGRRDAALRRHVPEIVLLLLFGTFLMAGGTVGFAAGTAGHRPSLVSHVMVVLIVVLVFIILDLDRPRRGLIQVSQQSLLDLQTSMRGSAGAGGNP